jgi:hypothetical protein
MTEFNPPKYGFELNEVNKEWSYETDEFLLTFSVDGDFLEIYDTGGTILSRGKIPANNQSLALMLKAFAVKREKV